MMRQGWFKLTAIQVGGAVCLPPILVGQMLSQSYGFGWAVVAVLLGNLLLLGVGMVSASAAVRLRMSTPELAERFLGPRGARLFSGVFMCATTGWFAIQLALMGEALQTLIGVPVVVIGAVLTLLAMRGIGAIGRLAMLCMPLLLGTMLVAAIQVEPQFGAQPLVVSGLAIGLVMATAIAAVLNLPTYYRHAKNRRHALVSVALAYGLALPLIELLGVYVGVGAPGQGLIASLTGSGGAFWTHWVLLFLVLAGWTTNNNNLYSAATCLKLLAGKLPQAARIGIIGAVGTALACLPLLDNLPIVLTAMGVLVVSGGAVTLTGYLLGRRVPFALCLAGCAAGALALSGVPTIDAAVASSVATLIWNWRKRDVAIEA